MPKPDLIHLYIERLTLTAPWPPKQGEYARSARLRIRTYTGSGREPDENATSPDTFPRS